MGRSQFADGQARYEEAIDAFTRMGDTEQAGTMHNLLAALHDYLGDARSAWEHRLVAFEALSVSRSSRFQAQILSTAVPSIRAESPETALVVQDAALEVARESGRDALIAEMLAQRASLLASLGRMSEAAAGADEARQHLSRVTDAAFRNRVEISVLATESDLKRQSDPAAAAEAASQAIQIVQQRKDRLRIAQLSLRLAKANIARGRTDEARAALNQGLEAFNEERAASTDQRPISALDESWQLFDASIHLSLKQKDYERAFALAEAARARSASETRKFGATSLASVQAALSPDEAIIALNQFDDEVAVWLIRPGSVTVTMRPMSRKTSQQLVARQQHDIWSRAATPVGGDLYNEIVRPLSRGLAGVSRLVVVPDDTFRDVSFAALYDPSRGRFLVEELMVRMSPSAAAFAVAATASGRGTIAEPLIFNGPEATDAAPIAANYRDSQLRVGPEATPRQFFADAAGRRVVHVSARTAANASYPLLSRLVVEDEPGVKHSGAILGSEIAERTLPDTGLVVIDEAGGASSNRGEGTSSLARAFMAAGVPAVVGTLPGADENAARDLMIGFHRELANGVSAEQALTRVQRNAIERNGRRLGAWSALVLYGSDR
jgi:CHAT domain-containing protein